MAPRWIVLVQVLWLVCLTGITVDGNQQFTFSITNGTGAQGSDLDLPVLFNNEKDEVQAWSIGVCHDHTLLTINGVSVGSVMQILEEVDLLFITICVTPEDCGSPSAGWNAGVVISITGTETLPPGNYEIHVANYAITGDPSVKTQVCPCDEEVP